MLTPTIDFETRESVGVVPPDKVNEWLKCSESPAYFIDEYCMIYDPVEKTWVKFSLWRRQYTTLGKINRDRLIIVLKARQLGLTWLVLCYILWLCLFKPVQSALLFSRRDTEAVHLLSRERFMGVYSHLPSWLQSPIDGVPSQHAVAFENGSTVKAFPTTAGDSYTATVVMVDEADLVPDLNRLMRSVKPTIDAGGKMIMISRSDKSKPQSEFKNIYRAARAGKNGWTPVFLPWDTRPDRDGEWYEQQKRDIYSRTASYDDLHEQYPSNEDEALAARTLDKRIPQAWVRQSYVEQSPRCVVGIRGDELKGAPPIIGLEIFAPPVKGRKYVIGADPAEGNPTSDDSAFTVLDIESGDEVAKLRGKFQPATMAAHIDATGMYYNKAKVMPERNNHGHAVILWMNDNSKLEILKGHDKKPGWLSSSKGKALMYDEVALAMKDEEITLHSADTMYQLQSIEGSTLRAPEGEMDDLADSFALATVAARAKSKWKSVNFVSV